MRKDKTAKNIIEELELLPHPEGGYYRETYRSDAMIASYEPGWTMATERNFSTCIYFLITSCEFSAFHRLKQDEIWHFYDGSPLFIHMIRKDGKYIKIELGNDIEKGVLPQILIPANVWFGATVINTNSYSLLGCTVSPGFDFADFELAYRKQLIELYPNHHNIITELTRK